jgi:hypothetical protein
MNRWTNLTAVIRQPDALRGLDHLIERARRVLDRYKRIPVLKPDPRTLARTA